MTASRAARGRRRGAIGWLPSGSARVKVYACVDQLTGKEIWLRETVKVRATRRETERAAEKVLTKLLNQVDERRGPKTEATVNELLDRWLEVIDVEKTSRVGYVGKIEKHIRPTIGRLKVARVRAETIENLYAQLRRCRDHCRGRKYVQHRTKGEHVCDEHSARRRCAKETTGDPETPCKWCQRACGLHQCKPLAAASIRVVHAILSGSFTRAVRWGWIAVSPVEQTEPPPSPRPNPSPPTAAEAALLLEGPGLGRLRAVHDDVRRAARRGVRPARTTSSTTAGQRADISTRPQQTRRELVKRVLTVLGLNAMYHVGHERLFCIKGGCVGSRFSSGSRRHG